MMIKAKKDMVDAFRTGLEIADKNDWPMIYFSMNKEIVRQYLMEEQEVTTEKEKDYIKELKDDESIKGLEYIQKMLNMDEDDLRLPMTAHTPLACRNCSNHPNNGGNGICHCTLGIQNTL